MSDIKLKPSNIKLNSRQLRFCHYYVAGNSITQSAILAGYSPRSAHSIGCELLNVDKVSKEIKALQAKLEAKIANQTQEKVINNEIASPDERQKILTSIYRTNITDFIDEEGNITLEGDTLGIAEYKVDEWRGGKDQRAESRTRSIKLLNKITAIDVHNKMDKMYSDSLPVQDNRAVINIFVGDGETKELVEGISGSLAKRLELPAGEKEEKEVEHKD